MPRTATARKTKPATVELEVHANRFERIGDTHVVDHKLDLAWTHTLGSATFKNAQKLIDQANADKLGGFSDWRLPTVEELFCLADRTKKTGPAIDTDAFPDTKRDWYWTGTQYAPASGYAWFVSFGGGSSIYGHHGDGRFVRAVRASQ